VPPAAAPATSGTSNAGDAAAAAGLESTTDTLDASPLTSSASSCVAPFSSTTVGDRKLATDESEASVVLSDATRPLASGTLLSLLNGRSTRRVTRVVALCRRRLLAAAVGATPPTDCINGPLNVVPAGTNWPQSARSIPPNVCALALVVNAETRLAALLADDDVQMSENWTLTATGLDDGDPVGVSVAVGVSVPDGVLVAETVADALEPVLTDDVADAVGDGVPVGVAVSDDVTEGVCDDVDERDGVVDPLGVSDGLEPELSDEVGVLVAVGDCDADGVTDTDGVDVPVSAALVLALCDADGLDVPVSVPDGVGVPDGVDCGEPDAVCDADGSAPGEPVAVGVTGGD
jgi:hypothetical protein